MKYKILILTIMMFLIPKDTQASFVGTSPRQSANCTTGINCGLVGHWTFDGKDIVNGVIKDASGNGNNGNTVSIASSTFYAPGKIGQAGDFDGVDDRVQTGNNIIGTNPVTVCAWIYPRGLGGSNVGRIVDNNGLVLEVFSSNRLQLSRDTNTHVVYSAANTFSFNKWSHVCATVISNIANMYSNGVISGTPNQDLTTTVAGGSNLAIGNSPTVARAFNGIIDDVRIYNRVLSAQEIQQLYSTGAATKVATSKPVSSTCVSDINCGLVGYWTFDGKDIVNGVIKDVSGRGNNGNTTSIATSTFYAPGKIGQGGNFDGVDDYVKVSQGSGTNLNLSSFTALTLSGWVYMNSITGNQNLSGTGNPYNNNGVGFNFSYNTFGSGRWGFGINNGSGSQITYDFGASTVMGQNKWKHITLVLTSTTASFYQNGVFVTSVDISAKGIAGLGNNNLIIGNYSNVISAPFNGKIDDLRIYSRALSAQEIQQLYSMGSATKVGVSSSATSTPACSTGLSCGLVGYWTFDGKDMSASGTILDKSGNGKHATKVSISTTTLNAPGKIGQGGNFDGVGYVSVGDNFDLIGSPFTLAAWIYPKSYAGTSSNTPGVIDKLWTGGNYRLNVPSGMVSFGIRSSDGTFESVSGTGNSAPLFKWTHVVVTYDNVATGKIYVNGVLNNSKTNFTVSRADTTAPLLIGSNSNNPNSNFNGKIDDVRIYNRVLSAQEIQQLYSQSR